MRFLERRGRAAEAEAVVRRFEAAAGVPSPERTRRRPHRRRAWGLGELWRKALARRTLALWLVWFGMAAGGTEAVFGTFAAFFRVAIVGALMLPEWRGRHLAEEAESS